MIDQFIMARKDVNNLRRQVRLQHRVLRGTFIVGVIGLAGLMARGFGWI